MQRDDIIEKLHKIKAIANNGSEGERRAAEALLASLMKKYDISPDELEDEKKSYHLLYTGDDLYDYKLFKQIVFRYRSSEEVKFADLRKAPKGDKAAWARAGLGPKNADAGLFCSNAEFIELVSIFEVYRADFQEYLHAFYYAYLNTNDLLVGEENRPPTEQERQMLKKASAMSLGIDKKDIFKQIDKE